MAIWQFFDAKIKKIYNTAYPTHMKKGEAPKRHFPHGLDGLYNHLSRDRLTIKIT